jgi:chitodextrinase
MTAVWQCRSAGATDSLNQFGITWTFDKELSTDGAAGTYHYGQFANGDYWAVGPVNIVGIDPPSTDVGGRIINGSMINLDPLVIPQGWDNNLPWNAYDEALNVAWGVSPSSPLTLQPGTSLVSMTSHVPPTSTSIPWYLKDAAVLTVISAAAPQGSFRPSYVGTDRTIRYNKSQFNYSLLAKLQPVAGMPSWSAVEEDFERPWIDYRGGVTSRFQHPTSNMPDYGRNMAAQIGDAALMLNLDYSDQLKETLLVRLVQYGIDIYPVTKLKTDVWHGDGGIGHGRKWPILFAGLMLDDPNMKNIGKPGQDVSWQDPDYIFFGEDHTTFYVSPYDVAKQLLPGHVPYETADIGMPDYGKWHGKPPYDNQDNKNWHSSYRRCCHGNCFAGSVLAAHIMDAKDLWNHDALFDYMDRYMQVEAQVTAVGSWERQWSKFAERMWDTYRTNYGCVWIRDNPADLHSDGYNPCDLDDIPPLAPTDLVQTDSTDSSISLSWTAPDPASDADLASGYILYRDQDPTAVVISTGFDDTGLVADTNYSYELYSLDNAGNQSVSAAAATFRTLADTAAPLVLSTTVLRRSVVLAFNEPLDQASAENINNYQIDNGITVSTAELDGDQVSVALTTSPHADGGAYALTVTAVEDLAANAIGQIVIDYTYGQQANQDRAFNPSPGNADQNVDPDVILAWTPGCETGSYNVYFSTVFADVDDATEAAYKGSQEPNHYDPEGTLSERTIYYWRIDQVNDSNGGLCEGTTWAFTTLYYVPIDDMESYDSVANLIYDTWLDGPVNDTGSFVDLASVFFDPVHTGIYSMLILYDNFYDWGRGYYSEIERTLEILPDWDALDATALTFYFHGDAQNDTSDNERMYVALEDASGAASYTQVSYGDKGEDMNDLNIEQWQQWDVTLQDFSERGVDLADVNKIYIGFGDRDNNDIQGGSGYVYIDDVRLYRPDCVVQDRLAADLSGNCAVDFADLQMMTYEWLAQGELPANLNSDSVVDLRDYALLAQSWLEHGSGPQ